MSDKTPAEKLLALCEDVEGLAGPHDEERCRRWISQWGRDHPDTPCTCDHAKRLKALKARAAAIKVCVEGLLELQNHEVCVCGSAAMRATLSEAARLASSEGEG